MFLVLKPVKCGFCRDVKTNKKVLSFFKISQYMVNDAEQEQ